MIAHPHHFNLIDSLGRYRFAFSLTVGVLSLASIGFVIHRVLNAQTVPSSIASLIASCIGLGGLLLLVFSITQVSPHLLLGELAKNIRHPNPRSDLDSQIDRH